MENSALPQLHPPSYVAVAMPMPCCLGLIWLPSSFRGFQWRLPQIFLIHCSDILCLAHWCWWAIVLNFSCLYLGGGQCHTSCKLTSSSTPAAHIWPNAGTARAAAQHEDSSVPQICKECQGGASICCQTIRGPRRAVCTRVMPVNITACFRHLRKPMEFMLTAP